MFKNQILVWKLPNMDFWAKSCKGQSLSSTHTITFSFSSKLGYYHYYFDYQYINNGINDKYHDKHKEIIQFFGLLIE